MDAFAIAEARIAEEAEKQTGSLDLSELGLTCLPKTISWLTHLRDLKISGSFFSWQTLADLSALSGFSSLQSLNCSFTSISDLSTLSGLSGLQTLDCSHTSISDLSALSGFSGLQTLDCSHVPISDLSALSGLSGLQTLDCSHTSISDLSALSGLSGLRTLCFAGISVSDLSALSGLSGLRTLRFTGTSVSDLSALSGLNSLQSLSCSFTSISDLSALSGLSGLRTLRFAGTSVSDLSALSGLSGLQILDCSRTSISDLSALSGLSGLQTLDCSDTSITDLSALSGLSGLQTLDCSHVPISDLSALSGLSGLQTLDCSDTSITDLSPLSGLSGLQSLNCSFTSISDLSPLSGLSGLQSLNCSFTSISDLSALSGLSGLQTLDCSRTSISDLSPLSGLSGLRTLRFAGTSVSDLSVLSGLSGLQTLDCSHTPVSDLSALSDLPRLAHLTLYGLKNVKVTLEFWTKDTLRAVLAFDAEFTGIPADVLAQEYYQNSLQALRAHLADLGDAPVPLTDVKLMVLGNGRIGKTQICNRLRGSDFDSQADSTHGIVTEQAAIPGGEGQFNIWDFGGQDIYHGTHALFLKSHAVFMLVWTPRSDDAETHEYGGMTFRNRPMVWWLDYVRRFGNMRSPLIVVQNQSDRDGDRGDHSAVAKIRDELAFCRCVAYSARTDEGRGALDSYLADAAKRFNPPLIGQGRLKVMRKIQALQAEDLARRSEEKRNRTLSLTDFKGLCAETGNISDPKQFLSFLDNAGIVFWREGVFEDKVILDQAWVLEAVYTVFDREKCIRSLRARRGRFTRSDLATLVWDAEGHSMKEQLLFIEFMMTSGICFSFRRGFRDEETEYIAPDLLPDEWDSDAKEERWGGAPAEKERILELETLPPTLMRNLIARIGGQAGIRCDYWQNGLYGYEATTRSRTLIEQSLKEDWSGTVRIQVKGGDADGLLALMTSALRDEARQLGLKIGDEDKVRDPKRLTEDQLGEPEQKPEPTFGLEPNTEASWYVSYAWGDNRTDEGRMRGETVDEICKSAEKRGVFVQRDRDSMRLGDRISRFMLQLAHGDHRIIVVLSDKYLKSPNCMFELFEIWRHARTQDQAFLDRILVFKLPDAAIGSTAERAQYAAHWRDEWDKLNDFVKRYDANILGDEGNREHRLMREYSDRVVDILTLVQDVLQPRSIDELATFAFDQL